MASSIGSASEVPDLLDAAIDEWLHARMRRAFWTRAGSHIGQGVSTVRRSCRISTPVFPGSAQNRIALHIYVIAARTSATYHQAKVERRLNPRTLYKTVSKPLGVAA